MASKLIFKGFIKWYLLNVIQENPDGNEEDWFVAYKKHNNDKGINMD